MAIIKNPIAIVNNSGSIQSNKLVDILEYGDGGVSLSASDLVGLSNVASYSFYYNHSLLSIELPSTVTTIGEWAFYGCEWLETVVLPSSLESVGDYAFQDCATLESITVLATTPPELGNQALTYTNDCTIYVPAGSLTDYRSEWSNFASRIEAISE